MKHLSPEAGAAKSVLLGVIAVALIAFLVVADPLGLGLLGGDDDNAGGASNADLMGADGPETPEDADSAAAAIVGLAGRYGEGDQGAVRLRLLWVGSRKPLAGQTVQLKNRRGETVADVPSDSAGHVLFAQVLPARGYSIFIKGEGFSPVVLQGLSVHPQATKDLGDVVLGKDVVLRGRVIDLAGRPVGGTAVSVNTIVRGLATKGMLVHLAEQAAAIPPPLKAATSDAEGYFTFSAIDDGIYSLLARRAGYASKQEADVIVARARGAGTLTIVLGDGTRASGVVTDPDGKPVVGAQVMAVLGGRRMMMRNLQREVAVTDERGAYVIDTLTRGQSYRFGVVAKGFAPMYDVNDTKIDDELERDFAIVPGGELHGVVTDEATGKPIHNARIAVYVGPMGFMGGAPAGAKSTAAVRRTDDKGHFTFDALTPGPVSSAVVQASGYVTANFSAWPPPGTSWPAVEAGATTDVTVTLKRGGTIAGIIKSKQSDEPLQGAEVTLMQSGMAGMIAMFVGTPTAVSGSDGAYELAGVLPGTYRLVAIADGFSPAGGEQGVEVVVPADGGRVERDLDLVSAGVVTGIVKDPSGEPIAGVKIRVRAGATEGGRMGRMRRGARRFLLNGANPADLTDKDGSFRLEGVGTDTMWVVYGESSEYVSGESKPFKIAAGETKELELVMLPGGSLRGTVVDENGRRMPGARVQVGRLPDELLGKRRLNGWEARMALGGEVYTTDEEGRFFAPNLKPGRQLVRAAKDGYISHFKRNVVIEAGQNVENYDVGLTKGEVIEGIVRGADGKPLRRVTVSVTTDPNPGGDDEDEAEGEASDEVEPTMFARTDDEGRFKIEDVKPGIYNVVIWFAPGHKAWMRERSKAAMHRDVAIPGGEQSFKLEKADPVPAGGMGGGMPPRGGRRAGK